MLALNTLIVIAVALQRLVELRISKRHRLELAADGAGPVADPVYPWMVATQVLLLLGCGLEPWWLERDFLPTVAWPVLFLFVIVQSLRIWVQRTLGRHWNVSILASGGRGIVTAGPYRFVRHPNYVVLVAEAVLLPMFHGAWFTLASVSLLLGPALALRIRAEEAYLMSLREYRQKMGDRPRFVPRLW